MSLRVYRIVVDSWPTPDNQPWARFYGDGAASPNHDFPAWLKPILAVGVEAYDRWHRQDSPAKRIAERLKMDDRTGDYELMGVLMPKPKRRNYLSASGASELAKDMRAFGAEVRIVTSEPVVWKEPA